MEKQRLEPPTETGRHVSEPAREMTYPHITRDATISGGQPIVEGTRLPVASLIRAHQLAMSFDEILAQYPSLTPAGLHAALLYYFDHQAQIDALLEVASEPPPAADVVRV